MTINKATRSVDLFNTIRGAAVAMMAQTPESPELHELLRKLQTTLAEYLGSEPSEGILVEPDPIATEDDCTYGGGEMPRLTRAEVLHRAEQCVCGEREQDYGTPEDNFETIAEFWETYLNRACVDEDGCVYIDATDVAMMMALLKIARIAGGSGTRDSFIDLAGYAACGGECADV